MAENFVAKNPDDGAKARREILISLAVFAAGMAVLQVLMGLGAYKDVVGNLKYLSGFGRMAADGLVPYRNFPIEYPPLGAMWLCLFAPVSGSIAAFRPVFTLAMSAWALAALPAVWIISARLAPGESKRITSTILYTLLLVAGGPIALVSFDFVAAALAAWALALKLKGRGLGAAALLAVGCAVKIFPAVLLPLFLIHTLKREGFRKAFRELLVFASVVSVFFGIPFLLEPNGFRESFAYHLGRGVEAGSIYAAVIHGARVFGGGEVPIFSHGSWGFQNGPMSGDFSGTISTLLLAIVLVIVIWTHFEATFKKVRTNADTDYKLVMSCAAILLAFILAFKVGSPQFFGWAMPFMAAAAIRGLGDVRYYMYVAVCALSQMVFPWFWEDLIFANPAAISILVLEKIVLVFVFAGVLSQTYEESLGPDLN